MSGSGHTESALGRLALVSLFALAPRLFVEVEANYPADMMSSPPTYFAITHKRDSDAMAPIPSLLWRCGWRGITHEVHFATRSDAFAPGFLSRMVPHPRWFSRVLRPISVAPVLRGVGLHPLHGLHLRPMETWVREWLVAAGDAPTGDVLSQDAIAHIAQAKREPPERLAAQPLSRLLKWRYHYPIQRLCGVEIFADGARRPAVRRAILRIEGQIAELASCLQSGHSLYTAPEGWLSPDGRLASLPGGLARLLEVAPPDTRVLPIAIIYDFIHTGRPRMFVDVAAPIDDGAQLSPKELSERLHAAWLGVMRFTCTQLATGIIARHTAQPDDTWSVAELTQAVGAWARDLAGQGRHVDTRLLDPLKARKRVASYVRYLARRKLLRRIPRNRWQLSTPLRPIQIPPGEVGYKHEPLAYAWNELQEMLTVPSTAIHPREQAPIFDADEGQR
ncbi:MAG TPA: hypothetical protein VF510_22580 [Ktedonobacterales bacterium]